MGYDNLGTPESPFSFLIITCLLCGAVCLKIKQKWVFTYPFIYPVGYVVQDIYIQPGSYIIYISSTGYIRKYSIFYKFSAGDLYIKNLAAPQSLSVLLIMGSAT